MKLAIISLLLLAGIWALTSCAQLAGTSLDFDEHGGVTLTPPAKPIQLHSSK